MKILRVPGRRLRGRCRQLRKPREDDPAEGEGSSRHGRSAQELLPRPGQVVRERRAHGCPRLGGANRNAIGHRSLLRLGRVGTGDPSWPQTPGDRRPPKNECTPDRMLEQGASRAPEDSPQAHADAECDQPRGGQETDERHESGTGPVLLRGGKPPCRFRRRPHPPRRAPRPRDPCRRLRTRRVAPPAPRRRRRRSPGGRAGICRSRPQPDCRSPEPRTDRRRVRPLSPPSLHPRSRCCPRRMSRRRLLRSRRPRSCRQSLRLNHREAGRSTEPSHRSRRLRPSRRPRHRGRSAPRAHPVRPPMGPSREGREGREPGPGRSRRLAPERAPEGAVRRPPARPPPRARLPEGELPLAA